MKTVCRILCSLLLLTQLVSPVCGGNGQPSVDADCFVLMEASTCRILFEQSPDEPCLIASTTKLMTALVCMDHAIMDTPVTIRPEWTGVEGSSMYLKAGEKYTVGELLTGLLLVSGNDAAVAIANSVCSSGEEFVSLMNETAQGLGMGHSHFANPHGLDHEEHYSTARDLALLMREICCREELLGILTQRTASIHGNLYMNHNKLLMDCEGMLGGKTGYTKAAGRCLVSACRRNGMTLVCVTLNDRDDWNDHKALYDWGFSAYTLFTVDEGTAIGSIPVVSNVVEAAPVCPAETVSVCVPVGAEIHARVSELPFLFAPVTPGERIGTASVLCDGEPVCEIPLAVGQ